LYVSALFCVKITVLYDGINTARVCANPDAQLVISDDLTLNRTNEVISFVIPNLELYPVCHTLFVRCLRFHATGLPRKL